MDRWRKSNFADLPIVRPEQDLFGLAPFASALATGIDSLRTPQGIVIALNGPWGSGKSSAINLIKHQLSGASIEELQMVDFNPWWFRGEEALVLAFFRELYAATNPDLGKKARKILPKLGARLLKAGSVVSPVADLAGASGAGAIASGAMSWLSSMIEDTESVEDLHSELAVALRARHKRYLVIIDDIDRLSPDEALAMFRMVKSVGRLPNVIYLLAFDRELAERVIKDRFPSEGPHYLEKIVQAAFEVPLPQKIDVDRYLLESLSEITSSFDDAKIVHIMNMYHGIVVRQIQTPRDATKYLNALSVTWPAVQGEVDLGDFLAIEAYRLFQPGIYAAIRANREHLTETQDRDRDRQAGERYDEMLLSSVSNPSDYREALMRLFPRLAGVWANTFYSGTRWDRERRICSSKHFQIYFRLSIGPEDISRKELDEILSHVGDIAWMKEYLLAALEHQLNDGSTRASAILDALVSAAPQIDLGQSIPFLAGLYSIADRLDVEADQAKGFSFGNNRYRVHWVTRELLMNGRTTLEERSQIISQAAASGEAGWLGWLSYSAWDDYHPRAGREPEQPQDCLTTEDDAAQLRLLALAKIKAMVREGTLIDHPRLLRLLFTWLDLDPNPRAVRQWMRSQLKNDNSLVKLAAASISYSWSSGGGDLVTRRSDRAAVDGIEGLVKPKDYRDALYGLLARLPEGSAEADVVRRFLTAWEYRDKEGR